MYTNYFEALFKEAAEQPEGMKACGSFSASWWVGIGFGLFSK